MPMKITDLDRGEMADIIGRHCACGKGAAKFALDELFGAIAGMIAEGGRVRITEIGILTRSDRKPSRGRNPRTGEAIDIPATYRVHLSQTKAMKDRMAAVRE